MDLITNLEFSERLSSALNVKLFIKRDDLFPITGGGSKARKLHYILNSEAIKYYNAIVTAGSNQSNHLRVTALHAAKLGWKLVCIIHDKELEQQEGNLKITKLAGAHLQFVKMNDVKVAMDNAMDTLRMQGYNPLYIWGGGHCVQGAYAFYEAANELKEQIGEDPDYIIVASGTGTTQAGLEVGVKKFLPNSKVLGVSISRAATRGKTAIYKSINELNSFLNNPIEVSEDIYFDDNWIGEGYEKTYPELLETIKWVSKTSGIILDPTYTGKAFHALKIYIENGTIPKKSKIVFWHTGGLLNLLESKCI